MNNTAIHRSYFTVVWYPIYGRLVGGKIDDVDRTVYALLCLHHR